VHDAFEFSTFLAERLGAFGIVPDIRFREFVLYFDQAFRLALVFKDTP